MHNSVASMAPTALETVCRACHLHLPALVRETAGDWGSPKIVDACCRWHRHHWAPPAAGCDDAEDLDFADALDFAHAPGSGFAGDALDSDFGDALDCDFGDALDCDFGDTRDFDCADALDSDCADALDFGAGRQLGAGRWFCRRRTFLEVVAASGRQQRKCRAPGRQMTTTNVWIEKSMEWTSVNKRNMHIVD